jgi:hypothetical protein
VSRNRGSLLFPDRCLGPKGGRKKVAFFCHVLDQTVPTTVLPVSFQKVMTINVYSKTLVLGPTTRNARAGSQSTIHPNLTGRRRARVTYRAHGHRRAARNNGDVRAGRMCGCSRGRSRGLGFSPRSGIRVLHLANSSKTCMYAHARTCTFRASLLRQSTSSAEASSPEACCKVGRGGRAMG